MSVLKTLSRQYLDVPQLITAPKFKEIADLLDFKGGRSAMVEFFKPMSKEERVKVKMVDPFYTGYKFDGSGEVESTPKDYGVVRVEGPLTYRPEVQMCAPDLTNYQELVKEVELLASQGKKQIFMIHNSPGGEAYMMMESARTIRQIADDNGIELIGYVDGLSASASYGLLSVCHKVIANSASQIGSVGVVVSLLNNSKALEKAGYKRQFITAGASKVPFDAEGDFKEDFISDLQESVDELYEEFTTHVSDYREGMTLADVKGTEAKVFRAKDALELGMIDEIMSIAEFKNKYLDGADVANPSTKNTNEKENLMSKTEDGADVAAQLAQLQEQLANQTELLTAYQTKEAEAATAALSKRLSAFDFAAEQKEGLMSFFATADESNTALMNSVLEAANTSLVTQKETAAAEMAAAVAEHETALEAAKAEAQTAVADAQAAREEFGNKEQESEEGTPVVSKLSTSDQLKARVKKAQAAKNTAK